MPLEDFLMPGETVKFRLGQVEYQGNKYECLVTDRRLLFYKRTGLIFKKDVVVSIKLDEIQELKYKEESIMRKRGVIEVIRPRRRRALLKTRSR